MSRARVRWDRSFRGQLIGLWLLLAASASLIGFIFFQFYWLTASRNVSEANEVADRACRTIGDRYRYFTSNWTPGPSGVDDAEFKAGLESVVSSALAKIPGVEGGIWGLRSGSLAYAYPTYVGAGPKTDLPTAELPAIAQINERAVALDGAVRTSTAARGQTVVLHACPLAGPLRQLAAWTMLRVYSWSGPAYDQLRVGMALLALTVIGAAAWLAIVLIGWLRRTGRIATALGDANVLDLPAIGLTGDRDMDQLVNALNRAGERLTDARRRAESAERLAAVGRLSAGLAHEVRNPLAAIRLKAENAIAVHEPARAQSALLSILQQVARLDRLLNDLLATTHQTPVILECITTQALLDEVRETNHEAAASRGVRLTVDPNATPSTVACDREQLRRALDNLVVNAIEMVGAGGVVRISSQARSDLVAFSVTDDGPGVAPTIIDKLFEPFVTARNQGTGLGLAIVKEIARAHGGDARLTSSSAAGSTFEIEFPCRAS